jgi:CubicO group peptidase (beta-lactamase class C family)
MNKKGLLVLFIVIAFYTNFLIAAGEKDEKFLTAEVDKLFAQWDKPDTPGAAIAITKKGKVVYLKGYGCANLEYGIPITPETIFDIASVSKQFTGMAIAMLEEQGKISLDENIRKHIPEVPDFGKPVTIRHLVHHISGIRDWPHTLGIAGWSFEDVISFEQILRMVKHQKNLNFDPGAEYSYSNTGYNLLAETVKRVTGKSFREWTRENIFAPLGMSKTHFNDNHNEIVKNRAYSYYKNGEKGYLKAVEHLTAMGSSSLYTTVTDLSKWLLNLKTGQVGGKAVINKMYTDGILNSGKKIGYAYGLGIGTYKGEKKISHGGGWAGFRTTLHYYPDQELGIVVLSNSGSFNPERKASEIADIYLKNQPEEDKGKPETAERKAVKINPDLYDLYVGRYQLAPAFFVDVTREGDRLMVQATNQPKFEVFPESESKFFLKVVDAQITFKKDEKGKVNEFILHQGGTDMPGKRVGGKVWQPADLQEFTGTFYCAELDARYTIEIRDNKLEVSHFRHSDFFLEPTAKDQFAGRAWFFPVVTFLRDEQGKLTGFRIDGRRDRDFAFEKIK